MSAPSRSHYCGLDDGCDKCAARHSFNCMVKSHKMRIRWIPSTAAPILRPLQRRGALNQNERLRPVQRIRTGQRRNDPRLQIRPKDPVLLKTDERSWPSPIQSNFQGLPVGNAPHRTASYFTFGLFKYTSGFKPL